VGTHDVPESVPALSSLSDIDYVDLFTLETGLGATPEEWARAMFGDAPSAAEKLIWRGFPGLRLSPARSPHAVAGWRIVERGDSWTHLAAASWFAVGEGDGGVLFVCLPLAALAPSAAHEGEDRGGPAARTARCRSGRSASG